MRPFTPARRRGVEYLDEPTVNPELRARSQRDLVRSNTLLGGWHAFARAALDALPPAGHATLLDIGTGLGDLPWRLARTARARGVRLTTFGCDIAPSLLTAPPRRLDAGVCASALALPFRTGSVDLVTCSQLLHHFQADDARRLVGEMRRVARRAVMVSDLRRSWMAMAGFWMASFPLAFHPVTRHDGTLSVLRGFTAVELRDIVSQATGLPVVVRRRAMFRLTAVVRCPSA